MRNRVVVKSCHPDSAEEQVDVKGDCLELFGIFVDLGGRVTLFGNLFESLYTFLFMDYCGISWHLYSESQEPEPVVDLFRSTSAP